MMGSLVSKNIDAEESITPNGEEPSLMKHSSDQALPAEHVNGDDKADDECGRIPMGVEIGALRIYIHEVDITKLKLDAIVNAANGYLRHGGGIARAIEQKAGEELKNHSKLVVGNHPEKRLSTTDVIATTNGVLPCGMVLHAVGPQWPKSGSSQKEEQCIRDMLAVFANSLKYANIQEVKSIAFPPISSGIFGVPGHIVATKMADALTQYALNKNEMKTVIEVHCVDINTKILSNVCRRLIQNSESRQLSESEVQAKLAEVIVIEDTKAEISKKTSETIPPFIEDANADISKKTSETNPPLIEDTKAEISKKTSETIPPLIEDTKADISKKTSETNPPLIEDTKAEISKKTSETNPPPLEDTKAEISKKTSETTPPLQNPKDAGVLLAKSEEGPENKTMINKDETKPQIGTESTGAMDGDSSGNEQIMENEDKQENNVNHENTDDLPEPMVKLDEVQNGTSGNTSELVPDIRGDGDELNGIRMDKSLTKPITSSNNKVPSIDGEGTVECMVTKIKFPRSYFIYNSEHENNEKV